MRRMLRAMAMIGTAAIVGVGMLAGGVSSASAATAGNWGTFTVSGSARAFTGTMTLAGFPQTTFTSTSRQAAVISGASTWQGVSTPPGAEYGSSRGQTYLNQRPLADRPDAASVAITTYTFAADRDEPGAGAPAGGWSFILGDVDADQATISGTLADGGPASADDLGFQGTYNSCSTVSSGGWSCGSPTTDDPTPGSDVPTWDPETRTLTGNARADDTAGATAWFSPTVALRTLTITYQQRSGLPVYQTWFADRTVGVDGTATLGGTPYPGARVEALDPTGALVATTTTRADGGYSFPALLAASGTYRIQIVAPPGAFYDAAGQQVPASGGTAIVTEPIAPTGGTVDFAFSVPPSSGTVSGVVRSSDDASGVPVAGVPVVVQAGSTTISTTTNAAGFYSATIPVGDATVAVADADPVTVTVPSDGPWIVAHKL